MGELSKKRAGVSRYRLNKDIENGLLKVSASGSICGDSLQRAYPQVVMSKPLKLLENNLSEQPVRARESWFEQAAEAVDKKIDPLKMRLIGRLEVLLSLAEKHRLMIEQQRRNISMLTLINQRQQRELKQLRARLKNTEHPGSQPWRQLLDRVSRLRGV